MFSYGKKTKSVMRGIEEKKGLKKFPQRLNNNRNVVLMSIKCKQLKPKLIPSGDIRGEFTIFKSRGLI